MKRLTSPLITITMKADYYIMKLAMEQKGMSQRDLASIAKLSPTTIQMALHGEEIRPRTWQKIMTALGIKRKNQDTGDYILTY